MANEIWEKEMRGKYLTTWTSPGGTERRQIDYITTNAKYRNEERTAQSNTYWQANMNQNQQRRVQTTQLTLSQRREGV